jgi:DNA primase
MNALQACVEADVEVQVASRPGHARSGGAGILSGGIDPDSLVAGGGAALLREAVDRAQGGIEFFAFEVWGKARANVDARARALEDAARLIGKIANPIKRDLIVGTLATAMDVDVGVVSAALTRGATPQHHAAGHSPRSTPPTQHPNAPSPQRERATAATERVVAPPPTEELELIALLADHPALIATDEAYKAFCLLTDERLRDMYSAARGGQSFLELAPVQLPPPTAKHVLSGKYASAKDPVSSLTELTRNLELRKQQVAQRDLGRQLAEAKRRGDHDLARQLTQQNLAQRTGIGDRTSRLADDLHTGSRTESSGHPVDPET